jgi:group I intron endonuclease
MTCIIYKITNSINEKVYIGQTWRTIERRFTAHNSTNGGSLHLKNALNKYGRNNFKIVKIASCKTQKMADLLEYHFINKYNAIINGYNIKTGGSRGKGWKHSEDAKIKIGLASKGNKYSLGNKNRLGKMHSEESIKKISETKLTQVTDEYRTKCGVNNKGKTWKLIDGKRVWLEKVG